MKQNPFSRPQKCGVVNGVEVRSAPVAFGYILRLIEADKKGDDAESLKIISQIVSEYVTLADGEKLDVSVIDSETIYELYQFATNRGKAQSDFTSSASPAGGVQVSEKPQ